MWFVDKFGNAINSEWLISLYVDTDGGTGYEVKANSYSPTNGNGQFSGQFTNGNTMTQAQAEALLLKMSELLSAYNPSA